MPFFFRRSLPNPPLAGRLVLRGALLWAGGRALMVMAMRAPVPPPGIASPFIVLAVAVLALIDARRRGETLLLANLGVAPREVGVLAGVSAGVLEGALALVWP